MTRFNFSIMAIVFLANAQLAQEGIEVDINISGKVTDSDGLALPGATAALKAMKLSALTDDGGSFSIIFKGTVGVSKHGKKLSNRLSASASNGVLSISTPAPSPVTITAHTLQGSEIMRVRENLDAGTHQLALPSHRRGVCLYTIRSGVREIKLKGVSLGEKPHAPARTTLNGNTGVLLAKPTGIAAGFADVLTVQKGGYQDFSMNIENAKRSGIAIQLVLNSQGALMLPQEGNPVHLMFDRYKEFTDKADNILSYQLDNGGWPKNVSYDGKGGGGGGLGTFDNGATTMEMTVMADAYKRTEDSKYLEAARRAMDYTLEAQYPEGGWPQFWPLRGGYSDHVTFNDDAMSRVLTVLQHAVDRTPPFDTDVFTEEQRSRLQPAIDGGVDYILKAQIIQNGKKAAWCAQHDKSNYEPVRARAYEHPSLSGMESVGIIGFLMTQPQVPEIKKAVIAALDWYRSPNTYLDGNDPGGGDIVDGDSRVWFRFYDIATNEPIFSNYDGKIWIGLEHVGKKKGGYRWWGIWGEEIIAYAEKAGY